MASTSSKFIDRYGMPPIRAEYKSNSGFLAALQKFESGFMELWDIPADINAAFQCLPNKLYCNKDMIEPLEKVLRELIAAFKAGKLTKLDSLITFDGCYNIRKIRGASVNLSIHSWAAALDFNAFRNGLGEKPTFSKAFVDIWKRNGFIWGGDFTRKDGMHFELDINRLN